MSPNQNSTSRQVLAELESLLTQPTEPTNAEVIDAHGRATAAIRAINERLANAHQLIAAGRRGEAIEIAEGPPHVLDEIALLDSQLIRDWEHWADQFGLPRFMPLRNDLAALLNSAYTTENQLEHLLRRHRLLAIGRANLRQRILVLQQLAAADPTNPQWNKALPEYQQLRLEQLAQRAAQGRQCEDLRGLQEVMAELRQTHWMIPVSKSQIDSIQREIDRLQMHESTSEAVALGEHIRDAFAGGDLARLQPLIDRWRSIESRVDPSALADVIPQVQSVIDWYDEELQQHQVAEVQSQALQKIRTIKKDTRSEDIHSVIQSIAATGAEVPSELHDTYLNRIDEEKRVKRLKAGFVAGAIALALIIITTLAAFTYLRYQREADVTRLLELIPDQIDRGDLIVAQQLLDSAPHDDERFFDLREKLSEKQLVEKIRTDDFQSGVEQLRQAMAEAKEATDFESLLSRVSRFAPSAQRADELLIADALKAEVQTLRDQRKKEIVDEARQLNEMVRAGLKTLASNDQARDTTTQWIQQLGAHRTDRWLREERELLMKLEATSNAVADRRDQILDEIRAQNDVDKLVQKITDRVGEWDAWESLVADGARIDAPAAATFQEIGECIDEERAGWLAIQQWNELAAKWSISQIASATSARAERIKSDLSLLTTAGLGDLPAANAFIDVCQLAVPTADRQAALEQILAQLRSPKMSGMGAVQVAATKTADARWYYFDPAESSLTVRGENLRITYFTDIDMTQTETSEFASDDVRIPSDFAERSGDYLDGTRPLLAPHVSLCNDAMERLERLQLDSTQWDRSFKESYDAIVQAKQLDSLVQLFLVNGLLSLGSRGSWRLATAYADHLQLIRESNVRTDVNWVQPTDADAAAARKQASDLLERLQVTRPVNPSPQLQKLLARAIDTEYIPVGWLDQSAGRWIVRTKAGGSHSGPLYVRYKDAGAMKTIRVGTLAGREASLEAAVSPSAMRLGRPVWVGKGVSNGSETNAR